MQYEKIKYTILRDSDRRPTVTICKIESNGCIGIGLAIRSINDNPIEKVGKVKARGRAIKALVRRKSSLPIARAEAFESISSTDLSVQVLYKSFYEEM